MPWENKVSQGIKLLLVLLSLSLTTTVLAEVFRVVDDEGNVTYTDTPPANDPTAEPVELPTINTQPALKMPAASTAKKQDDKQQGYQQISILSPAPGTTVPPGQQALPVQVSLTPALHEGDMIQLLFNGQPYGAPSTSRMFNINDIFRGEHSLQAQVINSSGDVLISSSSTTVHVKRHSILHNKKSNNSN